MGGNKIFLVISGKIRISRGKFGFEGKYCVKLGYGAKIVAILGDMPNFPKSPEKIVVYAPMLKEGIIWKNIQPWKLPIYCSLNIFQIDANCNKI